MHFLKISMIKNAIYIIVLMAIPFAGKAQKNILDRTTTVFISGEMLDPFYDSYEIIKFTSRINLGVERKLSDLTGIGVQLMYNKFKTYPWSMLEEDPYTTGFSNGKVIPLERIGYTIGTGIEAYYKSFRSKKNSYYPAGIFYELGAGIHNTRFTGYHFTKKFENSGSTKLVEINEPVRNQLSLSISVRLGKQWIFENNMFLGYGLSLRGHIPMGYFETNDLVAMSKSELFQYDVLLTDWFSTFVRTGYMF